jgi:hypothetical protein
MGGGQGERRGGAARAVAQALTPPPAPARPCRPPLSWMGTVGGVCKLEITAGKGHNDIDSGRGREQAGMGGYAKAHSCAWLFGTAGRHT